MVATTGTGYTPEQWQLAKTVAAQMFGASSPPGQAPATPQMVREMPLAQPPSPDWYETQETLPLSQQGTLTGSTQIFPMGPMDQDDRSL